MSITTDDYVAEIRRRSVIRFWLGAIVRFYSFLKHERIRKIARSNGAQIGENVVLPMSLARRCNSNLVVGNDSVIASDDFDLREPIRIGCHVIIGRGVSITTQSHNIDSLYWETIGNGGLVISDYVWCATFVTILPGCRRVGFGAVLGAAAVVVKDVEDLMVIGGNPAKCIRYRTAVHEKLNVPQVNGGDFLMYMRARKR